MFRLLAVLFLVLSLAALAGDLYLSTQGDGVIRLGALGEWWARLHQDSLLLLQPAIERHLSPELWDPGVQTVLEWPAVLDFGALALVFWVLHRIFRWRRYRRMLRR